MIFTRLTVTGVTQTEFVEVGFDRLNRRLFESLRNACLNKKRAFYRYLILLTLISVIVSACELSAENYNQITIQVDNQQHVLRTNAQTVREVLAETDITLTDLDRVKPDLYTLITPHMAITVTRVSEEMITRNETIPFEQQTIVHETLPPNETRLAQLGVNGTEQLSIRIVYEDGIPINKTEIAREVITPAIAEIVVIGPQIDLPPVAVDGTIAYLSNGAAWVMRDSSNNRRPLNLQANFDEHVFALSASGTDLLYSQAITGDADAPLNQLWLASTTIVGEKPTPLAIQGVLEAAWSPKINYPLIAYTTAERTNSTPGWRANNDLWLVNPLDRPLRPQKILSANAGGLYGWWGTQFVWSPDGDKLLYSRPDEIGIITLTQTQPITADSVSLAKFSPYETLSDWVWVPKVGWSPDGQFIVTTIHGSLDSAEITANHQFDLWLFSVDKKLRVKVASSVGMWSNPVWGKLGIAFGKAVNPLQSVNSRYEIQVIDHDGSNKQRLFPVQSEPGVYLPTLAWSTNGTQLLFVYNGNIYQADYRHNGLQQLTLNTKVSQLQWVSKKTALHQLQIDKIILPTTTNIVTATITSPNNVTPIALPTPQPTGTISQEMTSTKTFTTK